MHSTYITGNPQKLVVRWLEDEKYFFFPHRKLTGLGQARTLMSQHKKMKTRHIQVDRRQILGDMYVIMQIMYIYEEAIHLLEEWNYDLQRKEKNTLRNELNKLVGNGEGINSTQPTEPNKKESGQKATMGASDLNKETHFKIDAVLWDWIRVSMPCYRILEAWENGDNDVDKRDFPIGYLKILLKLKALLWHISGS
ncbi:hypothetical protein ACJX0J_006443 [Zea mays]